MKILLGLVLSIIAHTSACAQDKAEINDQIATMINLNGFLCAGVTDVRPLEMADVYEVTCVEYRGGSGTVRYILNARQGVVFPAG